MTKRHIKLLKKLKEGVKTACDLSDEEISTAQELAKRGLARDFANILRIRTPVRLRIWGISPAGQVVLEQEQLTRSIGLKLPRQETLKLITHRN